MELYSSNKTHRLLKILLACTLGLFFAPHLALNYFYGTTIGISSLLLVFSVLMLSIFIFTAYKDRKKPGLLDIFLIALTAFLVGTGTGSFNNLIFNIQYGNKIKGEINTTTVNACQDKKDHIAPYAIDKDKMIVLCPQSKHLTGLFYKTEKIDIPRWLTSD